VDPTDSELVDAWVTLGLLKHKAIEGDLVARGYDTFTSCAQAQQTIEIELAQYHGLDTERLYSELHERIAEAHA
jgi:hypothetical protein